MSGRFCWTPVKTRIPPSDGLAQGLLVSTRMPALRIVVIAQIASMKPTENTGAAATENPVTGGLNNELGPVDAKERTGSNDDGIRALSFRLRKRGIDLACAACFDDLQVPTERTCRLLRRFRLVGKLWHVRIHQQHG